MSYDGWDDDDSRPRRRGRRYDDIGLRRESTPPRSGPVTAAGVMTIIMSVMFLLCGGTFGLCGLFCTTLGVGARHQGGFLPPDMLQHAGGVLLAWAFGHLLIGAALLIGGIVTLQRRNWGRIVTLVGAGAVAAMGLTQLVLAILTVAGEAGGIFGNVDPDERIGQAIFIMLSAGVYLAYAIFTFIILLGAHNREEFD